MIKKYKYYSKGLVSELSNAYEYAFLLKDDLISIGLEQVLVALKYYDNKGTFFPYWQKIASREMKKLIEKSFVHLSNVSLDTEMTENGMTLHEVIVEDKNEGTNVSLYDSFMEIIKNKENKLSEEERFVLTHYLLGYSVNELAELCNCSKSKIYYLYKSSVKKIREILVINK